MHMRIITIAFAASLLAGCAATTTSGGGGPVLQRMLAGQSQTQGAQLDAALADASEHPLGSDQNPVRASRPEGQRAYLDRLRCADGSAPAYSRVGNFGVGAYGNIVDGYEVTCAGDEPKTVVMDMYHAGDVENRPVPGFTIAK